MASVHQAAGRTAGGTTAVGSETHQIYTTGQASLLVDTDVCHRRVTDLMGSLPQRESIYGEVFDHVREAQIQDG
jgi:hypothetical protein